ncbi:MAG: hypothetical protein ACOZBL_05150, partial [Patescibacteria group bacterium]
DQNLYFQHFFSYIRQFFSTQFSNYQLTFHPVLSKHHHTLLYILEHCNIDDFIMYMARGL